MTLPAAAPCKPASWPITIGAAGIAAAQFARCGLDVLVQTGHDKPWYDLVVSNAGNLLRISVKASENGRWHLIESYLKRAADMSGKRNDYHGAIDLWLDHHGSRSACCLVQFEGVPFHELPRIYVASPLEIAQRLRNAADRLAQPALYERYEWQPADEVSATVETLPAAWLLSRERIQMLLEGESAGVFTGSLSAQKHVAVSLWPTSVRHGENLTPLPISA